MKTLKELFNYDYSGGGYFREKGIEKGKTAQLLHGMQAIEYLYEQILNDKEVDNSEEN